VPRNAIIGHQHGYDDEECDETVDVSVSPSTIRHDGMRRCWWRAFEAGAFETLQQCEVRVGSRSPGRAVGAGSL